MPYITYDQKTKKYCSTKKRPNNQNTHKIHLKIAKRLLRYIIDHPETELTQLQRDFTNNLAALGTRYRVSMDDINIAHGVAISKIIKLFVYVLNNKTKINFNKLFKFIDSILSTESSTDDKGRSSIQSFMSNVKNDFLSVKEILLEVNSIIEKLNCCTRNLSVGYSSPNQSLKENLDRLLLASKGKQGVYQEFNHSQRVSHFFKQQPNMSTYGPKVVTNASKQRIMSSSIHANKNKSHAEELSDKQGNIVYKI